MPLRRAGPLLPPLSLVSPPSKHGWGPPGGTRNIYREGVVRSWRSSEALGGGGGRGVMRTDNTS